MFIRQPSYGGGPKLKYDEKFEIEFENMLNLTTSK